MLDSARYIGIGISPPTITTPDIPVPGIVDIGNGYSDGTMQQFVRTSDTRLWITSWKFDTYPEGNHPSGLGQTLRMYKADQLETPTTFSRMDSGNEPADIVSWAISRDNNDLIHVLWTKRASWSDVTYGVDNYLYYCIFNTSSGTWGVPEEIENSLSLDEIGQGDELVSMALDTNGVPHIVYLKSDGTRRRVTYRNKISGSWSSPTTIDDQSFGADQRCWHPSITFDQNGNIVVCWMRGAFTSGSDGRIFIRVYDGSWETTHDVVGSDILNGIDVALRLYVTSGNRYHLAYVDSAANKYIQYCYSDDLGASWTANHPGSGTAVGDDPVCGPGSNGKVRIYAHGTGAIPITYWEGDGGNASWGNRQDFTADGGYDCTVNIRWSRYFHTYPNHLDIIYWKSTYSPGTNELYVGVSA